MKNKINELKKEVVLYSKILEEKGLVNSFEGNISILDRETNQLFITPSGMRKSFLNEDLIAVLKDKEQVGGSIKRSSEYLLHVAALKARPDCNAVVHTHAPYLTAYAYCNKNIKIRCSVSFGLLFEEIPCLPYGQAGTVHIADGIEEAMKENNLILLGNHGCVCVGKTLEEAVSIVEVAEEVLKIYAIANDMGVSDIPEDQFETMCDSHPSSRRNAMKNR